MPIRAHFFRRAILTCKVRQTDLALVCDQGSLVGRSVDDYKSLYAAVSLLIGHRTCDLQVAGSSPGWHHCVVVLGKLLTPV